MALPSSGPLSMSQIRTELVNGGIGENIPATAYGLRALSAAAGKSTPDGMDEFLGYNAGGGTTRTVTWSVDIRSGTWVSKQFTIDGGATQYVNTSNAGSGSFTVSNMSTLDLYAFAVIQNTVFNPANASVFIKLYNGMQALPYETITSKENCNNIEVEAMGSLIVDQNITIEFLIQSC
jgi:hypothetical protein